MPAQVTRIYPRAPILLPSLGPLPIMPCKCCQRSVWYKLGIMGDRTPKNEGKEKKRKKRKSKDSAQPSWWEGPLHHHHHHMAVKSCCH